MAYWCHILAGFEWASKARQIQLLPFPLAGAESLVSGQGESWQSSSQCTAEMEGDVCRDRGAARSSCLLKYGLNSSYFFLQIWFSPSPTLHRCKLCLCSHSSQEAASARLFLSPSSPNLESVYDLYYSVISVLKNSSAGRHRKHWCAILHHTYKGKFFIA